VPETSDLAVNRTVKLVGRSAALVAVAFLLAACSSLADLDMFKARPLDLQLESQPAGADARTSLGPSCRTPCTLPITPGAGFAVTFALDGYQPRTVAVEVTKIRSRNLNDAMLRANSPSDLDPTPPTELKFEPNPVHAELEAVPPPPAPPKPKKKPRVAAKPATARP
jgi:hypothetical protein